MGNVDGVGRSFTCCCVKYGDVDNDNDNDDDVLR